jgi:hypothetical protein
MSFNEKVCSHVRTSRPSTPVVIVDFTPLPLSLWPSIAAIPPEKRHVSAPVSTRQYQRMFLFVVGLVIVIGRYGPGGLPGGAKKGYEYRRMSENVLLSFRRDIHHRKPFPAFPGFFHDGLCRPTFRDNGTASARIYRDKTGVRIFGFNMYRLRHAIAPDEG